MDKHQKPTNSPAVPEKLRDFRYFLILVWRALGLPDPTPVQLAIAWYLQHGPRRKIIEAFRGVGKSWITSAYVVWRLLLNPDLKFLVVSASKDRANNFTTFTRRLINEIDMLKPLAPRQDQRDSMISFDVSQARPDHSPSVKSVGLFGQLTGTRADEIIPDDIEVPGNSLTQVMRERVAEAVKEFDAILKPGGSITFLGTPQTEQSLYNLLPERGYEVRIWPARYPSEAQTAAYGDRLAPSIIQDMNSGRGFAGRSTDPKRFSDDDLLERELSYGRAGFNLQFMLDTTLSDVDRYPLRLRDLMVLDADISKSAPERMVWGASPELRLDDLQCVGLNGDRYYRPHVVSQEWLPYTGSVMAIDPAGRGKDETSYAIIKMLNGYLFVVASGGLSGGYSVETLQALSRLAKEHQVNKIIIEANFGDGMFTELMRPHLAKTHPCEVEEVKHHKQKELRIIDTLEPVISGHKLVVTANVIRSDYQSTKDYPTEHAHKYQLFWQMSHITRDKGSLAHDDRLDALSMAVGYWVEQMAQDVDRNIRAREERELLEELATFDGAVRIPTGKRLISDIARADEGFDPTIVQLSIQQSYIASFTAENAPTWMNLP